jgi:hypothetical protein
VVGAAEGHRRVSFHRRPHIRRPQTQRHHFGESHCRAVRHESRRGRLGPPLRIVLEERHSTSDTNALGLMKTNHSLRAATRL